MTTEELLDLVKLIKGTAVTAHDVSRADYGVTTTYLVWCTKTHAYQQDQLREVNEWTYEEFLHENEGVPWDVQMQTKDVIKLISRKKVHNVEISLHGNGFKATHFVFIDNGKVHDEGIDGKTWKVNQERWLKEYDGRWWTIDQVSTAESMQHDK